MGLCPASRQALVGLCRAPFWGQSSIVTGVVCAEVELMLNKFADDSKLGEALTPMGLDSRPDKTCRASSLLPAGLGHLDV